MTMRRWLAPLLALPIVACGQTAPLKPAVGAALPVKPEVARTTPTPTQLLTPSNQSRPTRTDELLQRSEKRAPDRFDLPPPG